MRMRLHNSAFLLLTSIAGLLLFGPDGAEAANGVKLEGNVSEDASLSPSLKVLTRPNVTRQGAFSVPQSLMHVPGAGQGSLLRGTLNTSDTKKGTSSATPKASPPPPRSPMWYAPGYEVMLFNSPKLPMKKTTSPDKPPPPKNKDTSVTSCPPAPTTKGVTSWRPGYEIKKIPTANKPKDATNANRAVAASTPAGPPVMQATPLLLPELRAQAAAEQKLGWNGWYKLMGKALYSRWQYAEVGAGTAIVRVTIDQARDVSGRLIDFTPAEGITPNPAAEIKFREAAVRAVNNVRPFEIPNLPPMMGRKKVTFDVEMSRKVDGPVGVNIARIDPDTEKDEIEQGKASTSH